MLAFKRKTVAARVPLPLIFWILLASCGSRQKILPPARRRKPHRKVCRYRQKAKQLVPPPECSPTCLETLQKKLDGMLHR